MQEKAIWKLPTQEKLQLEGDTTTYMAGKESGDVLEVKGLSGKLVRGES